MCDLQTTGLDQMIDKQLLGWEGWQVKQKFAPEEFKLMRYKMVSNPNLSNKMIYLFTIT